MRSFNKHSSFSHYKFFILLVFFLAFMALLIAQLKIWQETEWEREERHAPNGPQAGTQTRGCCSEDKASAHGTPALLTELNCALLWVSFSSRIKKLSVLEQSTQISHIALRYVISVSFVVGNSEASNSLKRLEPKRLSYFIVLFTVMQVNKLKEEEEKR